MWLYMTFLWYLSNRKLIKISDRGQNGAQYSHLRQFYSWQVPILDVALILSVLVGKLPMRVLNSGGSTVHYCKLLSTHVIKAVLQVLLAHYFLASFTCLV